LLFFMLLFFKAVSLALARTLLGNTGGALDMEEECLVLEEGGGEEGAPPVSPRLND